MIVSSQRPTLTHFECRDIVRRPSGSAPGAHFRASELGSGLVVVEVRGDIDMVSAPWLRAYISELTVQDFALILDLSEVTFLGTDSLSVLTDLEADSVETGRRWSVVTCLALQRLLRATRLESRFPQHGSRVAAIAATRGIGQ